VQKYPSPCFRDWAAHGLVADCPRLPHTPSIVPLESKFRSGYEGVGEAEISRIICAEAAE